MRYIKIKFTNGNGVTKTDVVICEDEFDSKDIDFNEDICKEYGYFCEHTGNFDDFFTRENMHQYFSNCHWEWQEIDELTWFDMIEKGYDTND